jgi:hypothetical protein
VSELHVVRPFVPDVARCMAIFNDVMPLLVAGDTATADARLAKAQDEDGLEVYRAVMRMVDAACTEPPEIT